MYRLRLQSIFIHHSCSDMWNYVFFYSRISHFDHDQTKATLILCALLKRVKHSSSLVYKIFYPIKQSRSCLYFGIITTFHPTDARHCQISSLQLRQIQKNSDWCSPYWATFTTTTLFCKNFHLIIMALHCKHLIITGCWREGYSVHVSLSKTK